MKPSRSVSSSRIMRATSSGEAVPREPRASSSSLDEIFPSPFASNLLKILSISTISSALPPISL
ncbi:unnamed protein product [Spirodela intermedia]|uniref:Uncharacterized protein n=2 Tax=Spirodela intermedia TaxID=51605 RepID=A0A7I8JYD5_SPIIN|nr:unnamed protein product [Spirodela intermedia]CAA6653890.1 unnamed protein product [Spirodela intermedia]CAA7388299.1 unnamed protein product [Spirodela intermedia]